MFAVDAPEGATVKATDSKGNEIEVAPFQADEIPYQAYILTEGVSAQAIDEVITLSVEYNGKTVSKNYSVLRYIYQRSAVIMDKADAATEDELAELDMLNALLDYAIKANAFFKGATENTFDKYRLVSASGVTVNGIAPSGMYAPGVAPFANIDAIEYDAENYELSVMINGEASTLDALKALTVGTEDITVTVEVVEKAHEHNYTPVVTNPTCTEAGYTTYTCDGCGDSYTEAGEPATGHIDNDADYGCDYENCEVILAPEADSVLTIEQALKLGAHYEHNTYTANKYYVTGTITEIKSTQYGNVYIEDDNGNSIYVYGVYDVTGDIRYDALNGKPAVGDTITLYGIIGTYSSAVQMKNGRLQHNNEVVVTDPTCTEGGYTTTTCTYCGATSTSDEKEALGHNYVDNKCSRCGALNHEHTYTSVVTDPTCTEVGYTTYTCSCGDSYKDNETEALGHIDENGDYECDRDNCSSVVAPKADTVLTIEQAIKLGNLFAQDNYTADKYSITGVIKNVYNTTYGNMYITDGVNEFCVYGTYSADGSTRYDALANKPVAGDTVTVYGVIGSYTSAQMKNGWITKHTAGHTCVGGTEATCTAPQTCILCGEVVEEATGHSYVDGACSVCGAAQPSAGATTVYKADLDTITGTSTSYITSTTTSGWTATNAAVFKGGTTDSSPAFVLIGDASNRGVALNGKTSAVGKLTSATLTGGISKLTFTYGNVFSEANGVDITINIKQNDEVVATKQLDNNSVTQYTAYTFEWVLDTAIKGEFVIEIVNNCPSNNSSKNKDRVVICDIEWTSAPAN